MSSRYGWFDDQNHEYVINRPDTPLPWINYLGNRAYFGIISNTAGGYSFYKDARLRRLTRYRYNNAPLDSNGRYVYIRDDKAKNHTFGHRPGSQPETSLSFMSAGMVWDIRLFVPAWLKSKLKFVISYP